VQSRGAIFLFCEVFGQFFLFLSPHTSSQKLAMSKISVSISSYPGNDIDNMCRLQSGTSTTSVTLLSILSAAVQLSRAELGPRHFRSSIAPGTVNGAMS
jgi:hypothetical protein